VRSLKLGRFRTRIEVSSARTIRLYSQLDTSRLTGPELGADSVRAWQQLVFSSSTSRRLPRYVLGNASSSSHCPPTARRSGTCSPNRRYQLSLGHDRHRRNGGISRFLVKGAVAATTHRAELRLGR
jgi:hypothetical protein